MIMRQKMIALTLMMALTATVSWAQGAVTQQLVVWLKNGQKVVHALADKPETRFNAGYLMLSTSHVSVSYPLTDVLRYTYEGNIPVVGVPTLKPGEMRVQQNDNAMAFDGLEDGTCVEVFSLDGKKLATQTARSGLKTIVSLQRHPAGTYLVKVGDATYKFVKR